MKKFTEEQYHEIIKAWESQGFYAERTQAVVEFMSFSGIRNPIVEALALANPATREWAHKQFVEKEKRYVWRLKDKPEFVISKSSGAFFLDADPFDKTYFTETEIENSPFKPEWFDKEEV